MSRKIRDWLMGPPETPEEEAIRLGLPYVPTPRPPSDEEYRQSVRDTFEHLKSWAKKQTPLTIFVPNGQAYFPCVYSPASFAPGEYNKPVQFYSLTVPENCVVQALAKHWDQDSGVKLLTLLTTKKAPLNGPLAGIETICLRGKVAPEVSPRGARSRAEGLDYLVKYRERLAARNRPMDWLFREHALVVNVELQPWWGGGGPRPSYERMTRMGVHLAMTSVEVRL